MQDIEISLILLLGAEGFKPWRSCSRYQVIHCWFWPVRCLHRSHGHQTIWTFHSRVPGSSLTTLQNRSVCICWIRGVSHRLADRKGCLVLQYPTLRLRAHSRYGHVPYSGYHPGHFTSWEIRTSWSVEKWSCAMYRSKWPEIRDHWNGSNWQSMTSSRSSSNIH